MKKQSKLSDFYGNHSPTPIDNIIAPTSNAEEKESKIPFHGVDLAPSEYACLKILESTFSRKLLPLASQNDSHQFGFAIENGHVIELKLTQVNLNGLIQVTQLPDEIGDLRALKMLEVTFTKLKTLPSSITHLTALERLSLRCNQLESLPKSIGCLSSLVELDLTYNYLKELPEAIGLLESLERLVLTKNALSSLPKSMAGLVNLKLLDASHNQLFDLPPAIGYLSHLIHIDLSNNRLQDLPAHLTNLTSLTQLDLHHNNLLDTNFGNVAFPPTLRYVYLQQNPLCANGISPILLETSLFKNTWVFTTNSPKMPKLALPPYCPNHGKMLVAKNHLINSIKGWVDFVFCCPVENCSHEEWIPPKYKSVDIGLRKNSEKYLKSSHSSEIIVNDPLCPPHDLVFEEVGHRILERCCKCMKTREEIENYLN